MPPRDMLAIFRSPADRTPEVLRAVREVRTDLAALKSVVLKGLQAMTEELTRMTESVRSATTVMKGAETLLGSISQQLRDLKDQPEAILALAAELDAEKAALSKAITDNTPAATAPTDDGSGEAPSA